MMKTLVAAWLVFCIFTVGAIPIAGSQSAIAALKVRVRALERELVMARAGTSTALLPDVDRAFWKDADLFAEHIKIRDIVGVRKPDQAPAAWLKRNKGFAGQRVTWRGVMVRYSTRAAPHGTRLTTAEVRMGKHGLMTAQVILGPWTRTNLISVPKADSAVLITATIQSIGVAPAIIKDGQPVHGTITVHAKGVAKGCTLPSVK